LVRCRESLWRNEQASYLRILPEAIGVRWHRCSLPLQRIVCDLGMEFSFSKASERILEQHGFELPLSAVASITSKHAANIAAQQERACTGANALPNQGASELIAEADGSFIRIVSTKGTEADARKTRQVDYKEARLCAVTAKDCSDIYYGVTFQNVATVAGIWTQTAKAAGMAMQSQVHVIADGATWIDTQRLLAFGDQGDLLIDLYHVLEYLGQAAPSCSDKPKRWLKTQKKRLKNGRSDRVIKELKQHLEPTEHSDEASPVRCAWRYLENRKNYLAYDRAIEKQLPLGSGLIERLSAKGIHFLGRTHQARKIDFRRGKKIGPNERLVVWKK
jgi:hypothetical protein